jgi:Fe-Mn family superoxide dismutase
MKKLFNDKIKKTIKDTLLASDNQLTEAYIAQEKTFDIKTDFLSSTNVKNHIELYKDYLKKFNAASAKLNVIDTSTVNSNYHDYRNAKIDETYNMNAAYLHELYFANMADNNSQINMDTLSYMRLNRDFGSFDAWQKDFIACAQSSRCGWVITYLNTFTQSYMNTFVDLHSQHVPAGMYPVIVVDMWQHAYYKDYLKDSKSYLKAMMKQLRWTVIEERFKKADRIIQVLKGAQ